jgi:hypothetical protein
VAFIFLINYWANIYPSGIEWSLMAARNNEKIMREEGMDIPALGQYERCEESNETLDPGGV